MDTNNKLFPYPIMSGYNDDYLDNCFNVEIETIKDINNLAITLTYDLKNDELKELIDSKKLEVVYRIECSISSYRKIVKAKNIETKFLINNNEITGKVNVTSYIVATENIENFTNKNFNEDYEGVSFYIAKGNIVAIGDSFSIIVDKDTDDLGNVPSIFSIIRRDTDLDRGMEIEIQDDKIKILLDTDTFSNYRNIVGTPSLLPIVHSSIILPALIYTLENVKQNASEFEDLGWFKSIRNKLRKSNIEFDEVYLEQVTSYEIAQKILDMPISKAFGAIMDIDEGGEE